MRTFILSFFMFISQAQAQAFDFCSLVDTYEFQKKPVKRSANHKRFTFREKVLIHLTVTQQDWLKGASRPEALERFKQDGEVLYYEIFGKTYIMVHYWPGDNEYGAFFEVKDNGASRLIGTISDGFIECK